MAFIPGFITSGVLEVVMRKSAFILFVLGVLATQSFALEIRGKVVSSEGPSVADAVVLHRASGAQAITDQEGRFVLNIDTAGRAILEISHPAYMDKEISLSEKDMLKPLTVTLAPYIRQTQEVVVTALRYPEPVNKIPAAETIVATEVLRERMAPNITEALAGIPGVVPLGSGGFSLVPTIRGLARNRILILIDNARIVSDRRTGPNASFVNPEDIAKIEVLRSPSSIFYGSDAIGGVVHIFTNDAGEETGIHGRIHLGYGTNNAEKNYGLTLRGKTNGFGYYLSYQGIDAGNYSSPLGEVLRSYFSQSSLFGKLTWETNERRFDLSLLGARGTDIGKPARDSLTKPTWYPRENQNLAQLHWTEKNLLGGDLKVQAYMNPNFLETQTDQVDGYKSKESRSKTQSTEFGFQVSYGKKLSAFFRLTGGIDYFGRAKGSAANDYLSFDAQGETTSVTREIAFNGGRRGDLGFYLSADYSGIKNLDIVGGLRWDSIAQEANPGGGTEVLKSKRSPWTGFLALSFKITDEFVFFANVSKAYRAPGLSELFYSGITGRGFIIAQPGLRPESSASGDFGLRYIARRLFAGIYGFMYDIDGLIDRYLVADRTYTYGNVDNARIRGIELEVEYYPVPGWKIFGNAFVAEGKSRGTGAYINDVPPLRGYFGTRVWIRRFSLEVSGIFQRKMDHPGPAEISIPGYEYFQFKASYAWRGLNIYGVLSNAFNTTFIGRPDPAAMEEPGRSFVFGVSYGF